MDLDRAAFYAMAMSLQPAVGRLGQLEIPLVRRTVSRSGPRPETFRAYEGPTPTGSVIKTNTDRGTSALEPSRFRRNFHGTATGGGVCPRDGRPGNPVERFIEWPAE